MMYDFIEYYLPNKPADYVMPSINDFGILVASTVFFYFLELQFAKLAYPMYYKACKEKSDQELRQMKTKKAVVTMFKFIYFLNASITGYLMLKESYILPPILGGSDSFRNHLKDWPYIQVPVGYKFFFMTCAGQHTAGLIDIFRRIGITKASSSTLCIPQQPCTCSYSVILVTCSLVHRCF
ncbi:hypothetical protein FGO68_gene2573 [Halteria grandinella]|uniref:Uncharacterized protein n=1 Tax=Halteria grandinella TaxID=5974 RepID=A0A8J8T2Y3_HALGN|nr:hypothetical protein FGO68_gene2573 [Halteria grandinella]